MFVKGPAGSGKQLLAKAVGSEVNAAAFISVSAAATLVSYEGLICMA